LLISIGMFNSKLVNILKSFTVSELKSFEKFIVSPYFTTGRNVGGLFSILKREYPEFSSPSIKKEKVYQKLFGKSAYDERKLKNLTASLTLLAEKFLVHNSINTENYESRVRLAEIYLQKGNYKLFLSTLKQNETKLPEITLPDNESYSDVRKVLRLREKYYISGNKYSKSIPVRLEHTEKTILSNYIYLFKRLKDSVIFPLFYNTPFENTIFKLTTQNTDFDKIIETLKKDNYHLIWLLEIYYCIYKSIQLIEDKISEDYYFRLKEIFYQNIEAFAEGEKFYILDSMATYCMMRDSFNSKFSEECFEVYKKMLCENAYKFNVNDSIPTTLYGNIIFWAYDLNEFEWLDNFIERYSNELKPEYRDGMTNLAKAHLYFGKNDFEKALYYINKVQNDFLLYKIQVRNLKFKIYYELNLIEPAYSLVDSFKHFLSDNTEIHGLFKERALDFINIYIKLLKAKTDKSRLDFDEIKFKIDNMQGYELRPWLLEKVEEFNKGV
jgi:hypothetical protein